MEGYTQYGESWTFFFFLLLRIHCVFGLPDLSYNAPEISYLLVLFMHFLFSEEFSSWIKTNKQTNITHLHLPQFEREALWLKRRTKETIQC